MSMLGYAYAVSDRESEARSVISKLDELSTRRFVSAQRYAIISAGLGRKDEAFEYLFKAYEDRDLLIIYTNILPFMDGQRGDPRFAEQLRRMNLTM